jgi:hypothetical protein
MARINGRYHLQGRGWPDIPDNILTSQPHPRISNTATSPAQP